MPAPRHSGVGYLGSLPFRVDPMSVSWSYTVKVATTKTVGGKVVQVYGVSIDDMQVVGSFGVGDWAEQDRFLQSMIALARDQVGGQTGKPVTFAYPPKGWVFQVYLKAFTQVGQDRSVVKDEAIINPGWALTLFIVDDQTGSGLKQLKDSAIAAAISRVSDGLAWKPSNAFNGPGIEEWMKSGDTSVGNTSVEQLVGGTGPGKLQDYLRTSFGVPASGGSG